MRYGLSCAVVEGKRSLGRNGRFEDACVKTRLRLTTKQLELDAVGVTVQIKELKCIELHRKRPSSPVFRLSREDDEVRRLVTLRWSQTGRQLQTGQYVHVLFSTTSDAR